MEESRASYTGIHGPMNEYHDSSALARMQQQYWTTKQAVFKKLGKKEDDCIIASDLELDLKLELFQTIEESFLTLMRVLENYQDRLCALAQEENALGRFLKENGKQDKTRAGKVMSSAGKALSYSAQQRLTLRIPLVRLYQEVETFQYRAIVDTLQTVDKMEKARTSYRGTLMWMKDVSQQLDPDTCKQLEKFRKVQSQVRKSKLRFDNLKLDTLQKVDLLSFSRCNLFSQALAAYQNTLLNISKKISYTSNSVAATTKGYQHYEFSTLKELTETSKKLAEETSQSKSLPGDDKDTILFFEAEYHDEVDGKAMKDKALKKENTENLPNFNDSPSNRSSLSSKKRNKKKKTKNSKINSSEKCGDELLNLDDDDSKDLSHVRNQEFLLNESERKNIENLSKDLLTDKPAEDNFVTDELMLLNELVDTSNDNLPVSGFDENFMSQWQTMFGNESQSPAKLSCENILETTEHTVPSFLPSQLLEISSDLKVLQKNPEDDLQTDGPNQMSALSMHNFQEAGTSSSEKSKKGKQDMSAWFNLFADLDPLANPDLIGQKKEGHDDRNC